MGFEEKVDGPSCAATTVLVVEDEEAVRDLLRRIIEGWGYRVQTADNGACAVRLLEDDRGEIGLVLTDLVMPVMGGRELRRWLKRERPATQVVLMTALLESDAGVAAGDCPVLCKPIQSRELELHVRRALSPNDASRRA